ncbi:hypothetical protein RHSIM_RhsimUnG0183700 [Rhododendron simsii]|uniref:16S rRNA (uracil(1498)-N(3))-methyltransferase n=1 Tax=Rhododendron simsii TaxID=118357 RepID=A0A834L487_RHOSS|nr:hypothetical protein RHSIM_RhsimUnG0183700 [Rhododendron simsii]
MRISTPSPKKTPSPKTSNPSPFAVIVVGFGDYVEIKLKILLGDGLYVSVMMLEAATLVVNGQPFEVVATPLLASLLKLLRDTYASLSVLEMLASDPSVACLDADRHLPPTDQQPSAVGSSAIAGDPRLMDLRSPLFRFLLVRTIVGWDSGFLIYEASSVFLDRYSDLLPTGGMHEWCFALLVFETRNHREYQCIDASEYVYCVQGQNKVVSMGILEKAKGICTTHEVNAETISQLGDPRQAICDAVQKHNIDLLVLGAANLQHPQDNASGYGQSVYCNSIAIIDVDGADLGLYRKSHIPDGPGYQEIYFNPGDSGFKVFHTKLQKLELQFAGISGFQRQFELWFSKVQKPQDTGLDSRDHWKRVMQGHARANLGQASLNLPACQCCYLMSDLVGGYLNPSQLEIPFLSEIPDIQKQAVYVPMPSLFVVSVLMGYNGLQDLIESQRAQKESVMNLKDRMGDFDTVTDVQLTVKESSTRAGLEIDEKAEESSTRAGLEIDEQAASVELILDKSISFIPRLTKRQFGQLEDSGICTGGIVQIQGDEFWHMTKVLTLSTKDSTGDNIIAPIRKGPVVHLVGNVKGKERSLLVAQAKPSFVPVAEATPVFTALSSSRKESSGSIIIGPEGGLPMAQLSGLVQQLQLRRKLIISYFTEKEVDVIIEAGATAVGLGTHRLQVKTAAIALLATVMLWLRKGFSGVPLPEAQRQSMSSFLRDALHHGKEFLS